MEKDIGGRLGKLTVNGRSVRTPALLPVVNPHLPVITPGGMRRMGAEALITNAYIFYRSETFRESAQEGGLHRLLDFDGVIMTDSGSYQLSVYGEVEVTNRDILAFQHAIGSDIVVPLDIPTSPTADRTTVERDLVVTIERLREARELYPESNLAGPVQGGIFPELRERAAAAVQSLGFSFCPIGAVVPLMEAYRYQDLVDVVLAAKRGLSPASCVHLFGAGHPSMFALAVAMGCDLFDSAAYALYAKEGRYITPQGSKKLDELAEFPCACEVCRQYSPDEVRSASNREELLARHNLIVTLAECSIVRQAIRDGLLWELVDDRCRSHPRLLAGYRELLAHVSELAAPDRVSKRRFFYRGSESCERTEVALHAERLARLKLGARVLVVIDGERLAGYDDVLLFKPPFGPYPPALSETFPIGQSEVPPWDEKMVRTGCQAIGRLAETHPECCIAVSTTSAWSAIVRKEIPRVEVIEWPSSK